ncbi:MAG: hypothetical protein GX177_09140 [Firmicutes bacterium]|jgi:CTP:molybdopterin cytidylyltransferase MocA|nr:hypothetical protein [Bacillota bacterium]
MNSSVTLVIFEGGAASSELEETMRQVRRAIVIDLIFKAQAAGFERIIIGTSYRDLAEEAAKYQVEIEYHPQVTEEFHFGNELLRIVKQRKLNKVLYVGGAAAPLISAHELRSIRRLLEVHNSIVTANNYYSADLVGLAPASVLADIDLPKIDNSLPQILVQQTDLRFIPLQRSLGLNFDIDTPSDLMILACHPHLGFYTKQALAEIEIDFSRCEKIKQVMQDPNSELLVYGRVNSALFKLLDELTSCRIRLYSEERGMKSLGRDVRGEVCSLLGEMISLCGYEQFFQFLGQICHGALIDSRIIFSHWQWDLSQSDRFYSDLGLIDQITHPGLREFTRAAYNAPIPVILGGHSLVSGGLWALLDAAQIARQNAASG